MSSVVIVSLLLRLIAVSAVAPVRSNAVSPVNLSRPDKSVKYSLSLRLSIAAACSSVKASRNSESAVAEDTSELVTSNFLTNTFSVIVFVAEPA